MALVYTMPPLFPTVNFEYKQIGPEMQGFFSDKKQVKPAVFPHFSSKTGKLKRVFDISGAGLRKMKNRIWHNILCQMRFTVL
nr:hypothetical protein [uncultured Dysosmobacter sp.]